MADDKEMKNGPEPGEDEVIFNEKKRWLFLGLPWTLTRYTITPSMVTTTVGLFKITEDDCYMYKIQDVKLTMSLFERMLHMGTISCYTGDVTSPDLRFVHVKHPKEIKNYLLKQSEAARMKRRTINTQDISAHEADLDHDGIPDYME